VLLIQGTQGVGKTNLLNYFEGELEDLYRDSDAFYIIRYYPDPEASFEGIIRKLFQEFQQRDLIEKLAYKLAEKPQAERERVFEIAHNHEIRLMLAKLALTAENNPTEVRDLAELAFEWLSGLRLFNKHRDALGVHFRIDSVEAKTQALRDLVFCSSHLGLLKGIFLLLDELEKQDYSLSKTVVLRYLSAIRALIDALPRHLFMLIALTTQARLRYFSMLPAFAGRLQSIVDLKPIGTDGEARAYYDFYLNEAKKKSRLDINELGLTVGKAGVEALIKPSEVSNLFDRLLKRAAERAQEGVTHRDFLHALHLAAEEQLKNA